MKKSVHALAFDEARFDTGLLESAAMGQGTGGGSGGGGELPPIQYCPQVTNSRFVVCSTSTNAAGD